MSAIIDIGGHKIEFSKAVMVTGAPKDIAWLASRLAERSGGWEDSSFVTFFVQTDEGWKTEHDDYERRMDDLTLERAEKIKAKRAAA